MLVYWAELLEGHIEKVVNSILLAFSVLVCGCTAYYISYVLRSIIDLIYVILVQLHITSITTTDAHFY